MSIRLTIFTAVAALGCAMLVFEFKGTVRSIDRQIAATDRTIQQDRWKLQTLRADYAYLIRPERLALQAAQLGMVPATTKNMVQVASLPFDPGLLYANKTMPATLPGGEMVELKVKPASPGYVAHGEEQQAAVDAAPAAVAAAGADAPARQADEAPAQQAATAATTAEDTPAPPKAGAEQVASARPEQPAARKAAAVRAEEAAKATKAAQAALAARIAQATARRQAPVARQPAAPAPLWTRNTAP